MAHNYRELSNVKCTHPGCNKRLKVKIIEKNPDADQCYFHYQLTHRKEQFTMRKTGHTKAVVNEG